MVQIQSHGEFQSLPPGQSLDRLFVDLHISKLTFGVLCGGECDWGYVEEGGLDRMVAKYSSFGGSFYLRYSTGDSPRYGRGVVMWTFISAQFKDGDIHVTFTVKKDLENTGPEQTLTVAQIRTLLELPPV